MTGRITRRHVFGWACVPLLVFFVLSPAAIPDDLLTIEEARRFALVDELAPLRLDSGTDALLAVPFPERGVLACLYWDMETGDMSVAIVEVPSGRIMAQIPLGVTHQELNDQIHIARRPRHDQVIVVMTTALLLIDVEALEVVGRVLPPEGGGFGVWAGDGWKRILDVSRDGAYAFVATSGPARVDLEKLTIDRVYGPPSGDHQRFTLRSVTYWNERRELIELRDGFLTRWNADTGAEIDSHGTYKSIQGLFVLPFPDREAWLTFLDTTRVYRPSARAFSAMMLDDEADVFSAVADPERGILVTGGSRWGRIAVYRWPEMELLRVLPGHRYGILNLALAPDGPWLFSSSYEREWAVWNIETGERLLWRGGHSGIFIGSDQALLPPLLRPTFLFLPDGDRFLAWGQIGSLEEVMLWSLARKGAVEPLFGEDPAHSPIRFDNVMVTMAPDRGTFLVQRGADKVLDLRDSKTLERVDEIDLSNLDREFRVVAYMDPTHVLLYQGVDEDRTEFSIAIHDLESGETSSQSLPRDRAWGGPRDGSRFDSMIYFREQSVLLCHFDDHFYVFWFWEDEGSFNPEPERLEWRDEILRAVHPAGILAVSEIPDWREGPEGRIEYGRRLRFQEMVRGEPVNRCVIDLDQLHTRVAIPSKDVVALGLRGEAAHAEEEPARVVLMSIPRFPGAPPEELAVVPLPGVAEVEGITPSPDGRTLLVGSGCKIYVLKVRP